MQCPNCGLKTNDNESFCKNCGTVIDDNHQSNYKFMNIDFIGIKNSIFSWVYAAWKMWKLNPVFLIGGGLVLMAIILIPGLNILAMLLSGAIFGIVFSSLKMIQNQEIPSTEKLLASLKDLWIYLVLIQLIALIITSIASILFWIPAFLVGTFVLFIIPLAIEKPASIADIFEKSYQLTKKRYGALLIIVSLIGIINIFIYQSFPLLLCFSVPFSFCVIYASFLDLSSSEDNIIDISTEAFTS